MKEKYERKKEDEKNLVERGGRLSNLFALFL